MERLNVILKYTKKYIGVIGTKGLYMVLLLYYAYNQKNTPTWAKRTIIGAIAYVLSPIDAIPDLTPFIGMTDDMGVLALSIVTIAYYINDEVKQKSKTKLNKLLKKDVSDDSIDEVDSWL